jgi:hypothetical protein
MLLVAFFDRTQQFFLTGGDALATFYLRHRETKDLDFFATPEVRIEDGVQAIVEAASAVGATADLPAEERRFPAVRSCSR